MKRFITLLAVYALATALMAQSSKADLTINPVDVRIDPSPEGGYMLLIRAKPDVKSVIITESTADPNKKLDSYTLRSKDFNSINGNEKRMLNGKFIESKGMHFLMSSTVVADAEFGQAFHIFIPDVVVFGYPNARYGEISMLDGAYLNIRSFALPYADYAGAYHDNPYTIKLTQKAGSSNGLTYNKEATRIYEQLVRSNKGKLVYSKGEADLLSSLKGVLGNETPGPVDLALCLDATKSMENDAPFIREKLVVILQDFLSAHPGSRVAVIQYRDYMEDFLYRISPLASDLSILQTQMKEYYPGGGRDTPEAVFEGLNACLVELDWQAVRRLIVLVGDAPPHPVSRGSVTPEMVENGLKDHQIKLQAIILPD